MGDYWTPTFSSWLFPVPSSCVTYLHISGLFSDHGTARSTSKKTVITSSASNSLSYPVLVAAGRSRAALLGLCSRCGEVCEQTRAGGEHLFLSCCHCPHVVLPCHRLHLEGYYNILQMVQNRQSRLLADPRVCSPVRGRLLRGHRNDAQFGRVQIPVLYVALAERKRVCTVH